MPSVSKAAAAALSGSPPQTEKPTHYSTSARSTGRSPASTGTSSTSGAAGPSAGATAPSTTAPTCTAPSTTKPPACAPTATSVPTCTGRRGTQNASTTCVTTKQEPASTRQTHVATA
ncbi:unk like zinc finger [Homo sapiens]|uniref:Unk like zinc finger n=1 Tax=Homo sapiens TaxID=9606 RepID=E2QRG9_HUMAN|nr:unk like zinc finger [Homo sapiens]KAI4052750.1 unk like zinc finger [Homo sapiens]